MTERTRTSSTPPLSPDLFHGLSQEKPHLCCGSAAPLLRSMAGVLHAYAEARADGMSGRAVLERAKDDAARRVAELIGQPSRHDHVAFAPSTGHALDVVCRSMDWRAGDDMLVLKEEYPSLLLTWRDLGKQGVAVRAIPGGDEPEAAILAAVGPRTRLACVSHVSWRTGLRLDLDRLSRELRSKGIKLVVDAAHSLGVLPVPAGLCDAVVGCAHKFMLGMHGVSILYWNDLPDPATSRAPMGWYSLADMDRFCDDGTTTFKNNASAFEPGNPAFISILALAEGIGTLQRAGLAAVSDHAAGLAREFRDFLAGRSIPVLTPADPGRRGTSIAIPDPHGAALGKALSEAGLMAAHGVGRLRVSFHGYNGENDMARLTAAISKAI